MENDDAKKKRHAVRLALNLIDFQREGMFNPTLDGIQLPLVNEFASKEHFPPIVAESIGLDTSGWSV